MLTRKTIDVHGLFVIVIVVVVISLSENVCVGGETVFSATRDAATRSISARYIIPNGFHSTIEITVNRKVPFIRQLRFEFPPSPRSSL